MPKRWLNRFSVVGNELWEPLEDFECLDESVGGWLNLTAIKFGVRLNTHSALVINKLSDREVAKHKCR